MAVLPVTPTSNGLLFYFELQAAGSSNKLVHFYQTT